MDTDGYQNIRCDQNVPVKPAEVFWCTCESCGAFWLWTPYSPPEGPSSTRRCLSQISTCGGGATLNIDWSRPWHEILHDWNGGVQSVTLEQGNHRSRVSYWQLAIHSASVPHDRWIQRRLRWMPDGRHTAGCPRHNGLCAHGVREWSIVG